MLDSLFAPKGGVLNSGKIWTPTKKRSPVKNAFEHWKDHGHEFPDLQNAKEYAEQAHKLFRDPSVLRRIRPRDGAYLRYNPVTNTFGSFTAEGVPHTVYKPTPGKMPARYSNTLGVFLWAMIKVPTIVAYVD